MQHKNSFDKETLKKIGRGLIINLFGAVTVFVKSYESNGSIKDAASLAGLTFISSIANAVWQYTKGDVQNTSEADLKRDN